jgi:hypothetical protein
MTDPKHPYAAVLLGVAVQADRDPIWVRHRFGLVALRRELNKHIPTGGRYGLDGNHLSGLNDTSSRTDERPEWADRRQFFSEVEERACDEPGRPATAADVKAGRAVFHLDGTGRAWTGPVPTQVVLKADAKKKSPPAGVVVQAETDANGKAVYGVIFRHAIRLVLADEVE